MKSLSIESCGVAGALKWPPVTNILVQAVHAGSAGMHIYCVAESMVADRLRVALGIPSKATALRLASKEDLDCRRLWLVVAQLGRLGGSGTFVRTRAEIVYGDVSNVPHGRCHSHIFPVGRCET